MAPLSQLLRWHDFDAAARLAAIDDAIGERLIVAPDGGQLHVAIARILIDFARLRSPAASRDVAAVDRGALAAAEAWADCPCAKHRQTAEVAWKAAVATTGTALTSGTAACAAWAAARSVERAAWAAVLSARTAMPHQAGAIVARWLPSPPIVTIDGVEYDLDDETTRAVIALSQAA